MAAFSQIQELPHQGEIAGIDLLANRRRWRLAQTLRPIPPGRVAYVALSAVRFLSLADLGASACSSSER